MLLHLKEVDCEVMVVGMERIYRRCFRVMDIWYYLTARGLLS